MKFTQEEINLIWTIVACVLHLGNTKFIKGSGESKLFYYYY